MKYHYTIILILFVFCISGCIPQSETSLFPTSVVTSSSSQSDEILLEKSQIIDLKEYHLEQSAEKHLTDSREYPARFLYVTDSKGQPVANIKCCTKTELETSLNRDYRPDFSGISMGNGLLPISVWRTHYNVQAGDPYKKIDTSMYQSPAFTMFLVNADTDKEPYVQEITVDFTALTETNAQTVVWNGPTPEETAKESESFISFTILNPEGKPISNCYVDVDDKSSKLNDGVSSQNTRRDGRFTNENGTVYFVLDSTFSKGIHDGTREYISIMVSDSDKDTNGPNNYGNVQGTYVCPYPNGELVKHFILTRNKEDDTLQQNPIIDLEPYCLDKYAESYLKELKTAFSPVWQECTAKFLYITDPDGQPVSNIKCCTKEELETILGKSSNPDFSGISAKNGLLPVSMRRTGSKNPAEMFQSPAYTMFLVNADTDGEPYVQEITVDFTALDETNALTVVWDGPIPEETTKRAGKVTAVTIFDTENEPIPNCFVELDGQREDGRYTGKDGTAFFVIDDTFPKEYREGPVCRLKVKVSDFSLYYPQKKSLSAMGILMGKG